MPQPLSSIFLDSKSRVKLDLEAEAAKLFCLLGKEDDPLLGLHSVVDGFLCYLGFPLILLHRLEAVLGCQSLYSI